MSTKTRWLALVMIGACGTAASAQAPYMPGMQPYPPYTYGPPQPYYPAPRGYAPPAYYPPPQPRVMYVPATPDEWTAGAIPVVSAPMVVVPSNPALPIASVAASHATNTAAPLETSATARANAQASPTQIASLRKDLAWEVAGATSCGPEVGNCAVAVPNPHPQHLPEDNYTNWLPKGHCTLQVLGGAYGDATSAKYNWGQSAVRIGRVCSGELLSCVPGAFETLVEFNAAGNLQSDFGNYFFGGGLLLRYNFVNLGRRLVPYAQIGVGFQYNDASRDNIDQAYLGSPIELTGQAQVGLRVFLCKSLTLDIEGGVQRLTNLNMSSRDDGITGIGGMAGLTYFFPRGNCR